MTNEREPLWSDERIEALAGNFTDELDGGAGTYHLFCVAMGNVRDDYEARIAELEQKLSRAAQYKGAEAYPCPLCRYEDGIFVESCAMHNRIAELETQLAQTPTIPPDVRETLRETIQRERDSLARHTNERKQYYAIYKRWPDGDDSLVTRWTDKLSRYDAALAWLDAQGGGRNG